MRLTIVTLAALSILSFDGCREAENPLAPPSPTASPDYAVYDAVLLGLFDNAAASAEPTRYVLIDTTATAAEVIDTRDDARLRRQFGAQLDAVVSDYIAKSSVRVPLDIAAFHVAPRIELLSRQPSTSAVGTAPRYPGMFWRDFYTRYPHSKGYISFSRPGYDASRTHALLSYGHGCGSLCGDWGFVLLERRGDRWVVLRRVITAES